MLEMHQPEFHGLFLVVSGGQTGADQGGLEAARNMGVQTGGWAPKGWRTARGANPKLADFGLVEHTSSDYDVRTRANVAAAYGTVIIASDPRSPGSRTTIRHTNTLKKPLKIFSLDETTTDQDLAQMGLDLSNWIQENNVIALNVAGNRDNFGTVFHQKMAYTIVLRALLDLESKDLLVSGAV